MRKIYETYAEKQRAYRLRYPEKIKARRAAVYARDRLKQRAQKAAQRLANPEKERIMVWRATGRPTPTRPRPDLCECCGRPERSKTRKVLSNDHDHVTKAFRGWLCSECNAGMGKLGDTFDGVMLALLYLARSAASSII